MAVQKPQTAWDVLAKMVRTAVRTRFETKGCGSKQKENERFAWTSFKNSPVLGSKQTGRGTTSPNRVGLPRKTGRLGGTKRYQTIDVGTKQ